MHTKQSSQGVALATTVLALDYKLSRKTHLVFTRSHGCQSALSGRGRYTGCRAFPPTESAGTLERIQKMKKGRGVLFSFSSQLVVTYYNGRPYLVLPTSPYSHINAHIM